MNLNEEKLPDSWNTMTVDEVADILDRHREPINSNNREKRIENVPDNELVPYYGATGQTGWIDDYLFDEELVLLGEDGAPFENPIEGVSYMINGKSWVNNHAHVLRCNEDLMINTFLHYYLLTVDYRPLVTGGTRLKLNQRKMKSIEVPVPPLEEQERIVREIEERLDTITTLEHSINNIQQLSDEYEDSFLAALVTGIPNNESVSSFISEEAAPENWTVQPLSSIANVNPRLSLEERKSYSYVPMDAVGASSQAIERFESREDLYSGLAKFENGDIIVARITPCFENGKMAIARDIPSGYPIAVGSSEFVVIRPEEINREYLFTYLKSPIVKQWGENRLIGATNRERIQISQFRDELFVPVPPKEKQQEIVDRYNTTDFNEIKKSVDALDMFFEEYKESVLSEAFSGNI